MIPKRNNRVISWWFTLGVSLLLCSAACGIPAVDAATVWSDNFNDGNTNGWTTHTGSFSASSYYLVGSTAGTNHISHASTVARGTWSFDLHFDSFNTAFNTAVFFMASDLNPGNNGFPENGYSIEIGFGWIGLAEAFGLVRYENNVRNPMDVYSPASLQEDWHIDITRGDDDHIYVYFDNTLVMDRQNSAHDTSTHFFILSTGTVRSFDNIVVSDTVDIQPPSTPTTPTPTDTPVIPGFPAVAIAVGIISALTIGVLYRRRESFNESV